MNLLVSGAGGFLGRELVRLLLERGHTIRAIVRPASETPTWQGKVEIHRADLRVDENLERAFEGIDGVVHLAAATSGSEDLQFASTVVATEKFLDAMAASRVRRLIHVSSLVVYNWHGVKGMMDETSQLLNNPYDMGAYTLAKVWQEQVVREAAKRNNWQLTILRPGFIWGPDHAEIAGMGRRIGPFLIMFGPRTRLPLTHVRNCADCIALSVESPAAIDQIFNVIDSDEIRVWRYGFEYIKATGQRLIVVPLPYLLGLCIAYSAAFVSRRLFGVRGRLPSLLMPRRFESQFKPIRFSNRKLKSILVWQAPLSFIQCLSSTFSKNN